MEARRSVPVTAGKVIAAYQPRSIQDAATLLACVFMDDAAENANGLSTIEQLLVLENVKRFLRDYVKAKKGVDAAPVRPPSIISTRRLLRPRAAGGDDDFRTIPRTLG